MSGGGMGGSSMSGGSMNGGSMGGSGYGSGGMSGGGMGGGGVEMREIKSTQLYTSLFRITSHFHPCPGQPTASTAYIWP